MMTALVCGECGIEFHVPEHWRKAREDQGTTFYCPNGHPRVYCESTVTRLEREKRTLELSLQSQVNAAQHAKLVAERERDKAIKEKRKVERRIAHGVCPCCNKTFADVSEHMMTEHKDLRLPAGKSTKQIAGPIQ